MQGSAPSCAGRSAALRQHGPKCRIKSSQIKSIYLNHPSQGNPTNYHIILDPRGKAAPPTSQQIGQFSSEVSEVLTPKRHPFVFFFLPHPQESSALSQSQAMFVELGECSRKMLSEAFWTPNIASSQFDEYSQLGSRSKGSSN